MISGCRASCPWQKRKKFEPSKNKIGKVAKTLKVWREFFPGSSRCRRRPNFFPGLPFIKVPKLHLQTKSLPSASNRGHASRDKHAGIGWWHGGHYKQVLVQKNPIDSLCSVHTGPKSSSRLSCLPENPSSAIRRNCGLRKQGGQRFRRPRFVVSPWWLESLVRSPCQQPAFLWYDTKGKDGTPVSRPCDYLFYQLFERVEAESVLPGEFFSERMFAWSFRTQISILSTLK